MPDDEPVTKPEAPRSKSSVETFSVDALMLRIEHQARLAQQRGDDDAGEFLLRVAAVVKTQLDARAELIRDLVSIVPSCGRCGDPATMRYAAAIWCDDHAPADSIELPRAASVRRAKKF